MTMMSRILFMFSLGIHWTTAVNMCTDSSTVSTYVTLNLIKGTDDSGCYCSIKLYNIDTPESVKSRIIFEVIKFSGCRYILDVSYNNNSPSFSCSNNNTYIFFNINKTDEIKLYLELATSYQNDTEFEVKITSTVTKYKSCLATLGPLLRLTCFTPNANTYSTTNTQTSSERTTTTKANSTSDIIPSSEKTTPTSIPSTVSYSEETSIQTTIPLSTTGLTEDNSSNALTKEDCDDNDSGNDGIIGGVIGVVIGGVIVGVSIFIIKRIVKNRKKKSTSEIYSSTSTQNQPESQYTDLQLS
ncbi:hypothetical protein LOTGIDRAFT_169910 [Lottia gigantea]|uniref:Uncharacterized protein n=1 Tax=Lottia gigantea TaxID=225164 RepID=V4B2H9_LOTGI|nr:hypothetical protein LOTGIDRAFT_169910 [Lottia gigantea]ESO82589.1 hypothetical protein LOTGIDRAFT_169910 [Lottia gigantea]